MNICSSCLEPCQAETVDFGIGLNQYGSEWQNDVNLAVVSSCCDSPIIEGDENMQYQVTFNHPKDGQKTFIFDSFENAETVKNLLNFRWGKAANPILSLYGPIPVPSPEFVRVQQLRAAHYGLEVDESDYYSEY